MSVLAKADALNATSRITRLMMVRTDPKIRFTLLGDSPLSKDGHGTLLHQMISGRL